MSYTGTAAMIGKGTTLANCATSGGTYTPLAEVVSVSHPRIKVGKIDATNFDSLNSFMEYISAVWMEGDDIKVGLHYLKTQTATLAGLVGVSPQFWKITLPDTSAWVIPGFISDYGGADITPKGKIEQDFSVTVTGKPVFTPAS